MTPFYLWALLAIGVTRTMAVGCYGGGLVYSDLKPDKNADSAKVAVDNAIKANCEWLVQESINAGYDRQVCVSTDTGTHLILQISRKSTEGPVPTLDRCLSGLREAAKCGHGGIYAFADNHIFNWFYSYEYRVDPNMGYCPKGLTSGGAIH